MTEPAISPELDALVERLVCAPCAFELIVGLAWLPDQRVWRLQFKFPDGCLVLLPFNDVRLAAQALGEIREHVAVLAGPARAEGMRQLGASLLAIVDRAERDTRGGSVH